MNEEGELKNRVKSHELLFVCGVLKTPSEAYTAGFNEALATITDILDEAKQEFYDALMDTPFPTQARNDKLTELIKKWFGDTEK
jgi:hypothetical protein